jgi:excisionase family DNA binding protein
MAILPPAEDALRIDRLLVSGGQPAPAYEIRGDSSNTSNHAHFSRAHNHGHHQQPRNTACHLAPVPARAHHDTVPTVARDAIVSLVSDRERPTVDRLLTADELAERLGMKTEWVWAQARAGRIPHVRLGRYRRFRESAVEAWLRDLETGGSGRPATSQPRPIPLRRRA